jgi:hypothetical protein
MTTTIRTLGTPNSSVRTPPRDAKNAEKAPRPRGRTRTRRFESRTTRIDERWIPREASRRNSTSATRDFERISTRSIARERERAVKRVRVRRLGVRLGDRRARRTRRRAWCPPPRRTRGRRRRDRNHRRRVDATRGGDDASIRPVIDVSRRVSRARDVVARGADARIEIGHQLYSIKENLHSPTRVVRSIRARVS